MKMEHKDLLKNINAIKNKKIQNRLRRKYLSGGKRMKIDSMLEVAKKNSILKDEDAKYIKRLEFFINSKKNGKR